jgi:uncharacterized protein
MAAGAINAVIGSGSLITFPTLVGVGLGSVPANVSNNVGLVSGSWSAVYGYRRELGGQRDRVTWLLPMTVIGAVCGALLLLSLPTKVFDRVVPFLVLLGVVLIAAAPTVSARATARRERLTASASTNPSLSARHRAVPGWLLAGVLATGVYGGYFGAGQGVILTGVLGMGLNDDLRRVNAVKNLLSAAANTTALVVFVLRRASAVNWTAVGILAVASTIGAQIGSQFGRRIPQHVLRALIVVIGLGVSVYLFLR